MFVKLKKSFEKYAKNAKSLDEKRGSKSLPSWNKTGEIVGKGGAFCRGRRVTGSANFIGYTGPKRPLRTSL